MTDSQKAKQTSTVAAGSNTALSDHLRGRQVYAAEQNVRQALIPSALAAVLTTAFFYQIYGAPMLLWLAAVVIFCVLRTLMAHDLVRKGPKPVPPQSIWIYASLSVIGSAVIMGYPSWISLRSEGFVFAFMLALSLGTFWCGSFVHGPVLPSAVAFIATELVIFIVSAFALGMNWERASLVTLFAFGTGAAIHIVRQHSVLFRNSVMQQIDLEQNSELIGLLLREHEDQSSDWLWQTDKAGRIVQPSSRFADVFISRSPIDGVNLVRLLDHPEIAGNAESVGKLSSCLAACQSFRDLVISAEIAGAPRWFSLSGRPLYTEHGAFTGYRGVMGDVTAAKLAEAKVVHLAHHDSLTDLPNRTQLTASLRRSLAAGRPFAVLSIDLDGFKPVNDRFGHPTGDALLVEVAQRLREAVGPLDIVARFGGDEFMVQTSNCRPDEVETLCHKLLAAISIPYDLAGAPAMVGASIGVAFAPADGHEEHELLKSADAALYRAKHSGRGTFRFFAPEMDQQLQERQILIQDLRIALAQNQLSLHYQPVVHALSGKVSGCEALLRWQHPLRGPISPADFIPLAEEAGLIQSIGAWVIFEACREAASWSGDKHVAVNVSPVQFSDQDLPQRIADALAETGLEPSRLEIEVTETVLLTDADAALEIMRRIRALGVRVALDDFGTGYSSLRYLQLFPFDKIKIDRSFVSNLDQSHDSQIIVQAIIDIATGLGMTITAEGVETDAEADHLRRTGCQELQGFLFSRPQPTTSLRTVMDRQDAA